MKKIIETSMTLTCLNFLTVAKLILNIVFNELVVEVLIRVNKFCSLYMYFQISSPYLYNVFPGNTIFKVILINYNGDAVYLYQCIEWPIYAREQEYILAIEAK